MHRPTTAVLLLAGSLLAFPLSAQPKAFDLLAQVRKTYGEMPSYRDHGEIEKVTGAKGTEKKERYRFTFAAQAGGDFRFSLEPLAPEARPESARVLWRNQEGMYAYDAGLQQYRPVKSFVTELVGLLGDGAFDALGAAVYLTGADALTDPEAASVEGSEACGEAACWLLVLSRLGGVESRLWVEKGGPEMARVRQVEVRLSGPDRTTLRVRHEIEAAAAPLAAADLAFTPPSAARLVDVWRPDLPRVDHQRVAAAAAAPPARAGGSSGEPGEPAETFGDVITVAIATVALRVTASDGSPVLGLEPKDFRVRVGKEEVPVDSVDWISSSEPVDASAGPSSESAAAAAERERIAAGKRVVFFVQADLNPTRLKGQMILLPLADKLMKTLNPADRMAVVSFDSRVRLRHDWTTDPAAVRESLAESIRFGGGNTAPRSQDASSLTRLMDLDAAQRAASAEKALEVTANALAPLPGEKVIVYLGWGLGRYDAGGVVMRPDFLPAVRALRAAKTTVFVLDVTDADHHSLELGLMNVATATGGTYSRTRLAPNQAVDVLARTIAGHYVLTLDGSRIPKDGGALRVDLQGRKGTVLVRPVSYAW